MNDNTHLVSNAVDFDFFQTELRDKEMDEIKGPKILYLGSLDQRVDYRLLKKMAVKRRDWQWCLLDRSMIGSFLKKDPN